MHQQNQNLVVNVPHQASAAEEPLLLPTANADGDQGEQAAQTLNTEGEQPLPLPH
jgi:hypothetical protein